MALFPVAAVIRTSSIPLCPVMFRAMWVERSAALAAEVLRLEESARELELRIGAHLAELQQTQTRRESLLQSIVDGQRTLDNDVQTLVGLRDELRAADETAAALRASVDAQDVPSIRVLDENGAVVGSLPG